MASLKLALAMWMVPWMCHEIEFVFFFSFGWVLFVERKGVKIAKLLEGRVNHGWAQGWYKDCSLWKWEFDSGEPLSSIFHMILVNI